MLGSATALHSCPCAIAAVWPSVTTATSKKNNLISAPICHIHGAMPPRHQIRLFFQIVLGLLQGKMHLLPQPDHAIIFGRRNTCVRVISRIIVAGGSPRE